MNHASWLYPLIGGVLVGIAVTLMLLFNGRVTGISGIISGALSFRRTGADLLWRGAFVAGLVVGGIVLRLVNPETLVNTSGRGLSTVMIAGLLVGFGTAMGGGCTSGHGVCGISRFSVRSVIATVTFILFGVLTVSAFRLLLGSQA